MTDDLVKRLRSQFSIDQVRDNPTFVASTYEEERDEAADRIESQIKLIDASGKVHTSMLARIEELETALKFYECGCKQDSCTPEEPKFRSIKCGWIAKAALGKKKDA
jgi:hypothetical protein